MEPPVKDVVLADELSAPTSAELNEMVRDAARKLGAAGRRVATFIAGNPQVVLASSAAAIGDRTGTSDATVVRTIQSLGFGGLGELKRAILEGVGDRSTPADDMRRTLGNLEKSTGHALDCVMQTHQEGLDVLRSDDCRAQIADAVQALDASKRIVVFGIGPSAALAVYVAVMLARCGRPNRTLNATGSMLADQLLDLRPGDALLILAYGRVYREVTAVFSEARKLGLPKVLVTEAKETALAKMADVVVAIPRGRPGQLAMHGATFVGLEALILSLAAARPNDALNSLDKLNELRRTLEPQRKPRRFA
jgi:DNA-binding MurR/RpiR family transcriptional regulator